MAPDRLKPEKGKVYYEEQRRNQKDLREMGLSARFDRCGSFEPNQASNPNHLKKHPERGRKVGLYWRLLGEKGYHNIRIDQRCDYH